MAREENAEAIKRQLTDLWQEESYNKPSAEFTNQSILYHASTQTSIAARRAESTCSSHPGPLRKRRKRRLYPDCDVRNLLIPVNIAPIATWSCPPFSIAPPLADE
jgi:hypothetical protein